MKCTLLTLTAAAMLLAGSAVAQERNLQEPPKWLAQADGAAQPGARPDDRRPPGADRVRRPPNPVMEALDKDRDGSLSAEEIQGAVLALKQLDKNKDGKLDREEIRPRGPSAADRTEMIGRFVSRMMENDKNGDGKLTADELPERAQRMLEFGDTDGDKALSKAELTKAMSDRIGRGRAGGDRPPRRDGAGGDRPDRPQRPAGE